MGGDKSEAHRKDCDNDDSPHLTDEVSMGRSLNRTTSQLRLKKIAQLRRVLSANRTYGSFHRGSETVVVPELNPDGAVQYYMVLLLLQSEIRIRESGIRLESGIRIPYFRSVENLEFSELRRRVLDFLRSGCYCPSLPNRKCLLKYY